MVDANSETDEHEFAEFAEFAASDGARLRKVLTAYFGVDVGHDVCADALEHGWANWSRVRDMENRAGYLFTVAKSAARKHRRWERRIVLPSEPPHDGDVPVDPGLHVALAGLTPAQRACVVMTKVYDWTYEQTGDALDMPVTSVRNHVYRGLAALRVALEDSEGGT